MSLQLREHLHWCESVGRAVFLDAERDRYFCLSMAANDAFLRLAAQDMKQGDSELIGGLVARGILVGEADCYAPIRMPATIERAISDVPVDHLPRLSPAHIFRALAAEVHATWRLKTKRFADVLEAARNSHANAQPVERDPDSLLKSIVAASAVISYFKGASGRCLVRALAVHTSCKRSNLRPKLVFGVVAHPFVAHCWVQLGNVVLVGSFEQAQLFTPILVVE